MCVCVCIYIYIYIYITSIGLGTGTILKVSIWHRYRKKKKRYPTLVPTRLVSSELIFPSGFLPEGRDIEIDRAHRVYDGGRGSDRPHTLIFRVLRWHDRSDNLKGAQQACPVKCAQNNVTLLFFPDFSPATAIRRKAFGPVLKKMTALGLQPFLIYPAVNKLRHKGEQKSFDSPQKAEDFISYLSQHKTNSGRYLSGPAGGA